MKKVIFFVLTAVLFIATSCLGGEDTGPSSSAEYYGELTVIDTETGEISYFDEESQVVVTIPNIYEAKFDIVFKGVKFDKMMPALNVSVDGVPFSNTISEDETSINYIFTAKEGLNPKLKYKVQLVSTLGELEYKSSPVSISVKMGSAKLTMLSSDTTLFAKDILILELLNTSAGVDELLLTCKERMTL